jgi:hypothetical protein
MGRIGIKYRGHSSLEVCSTCIQFMYKFMVVQFPKRQFSFKIWDEDNGGQNEPLLGMPEENDWIL